MKYTQEYWEDVALVAENIPSLDTLFGKRILVTGATGMICSSVIDVITWLNRSRNAKIQLAMAGRSIEGIASRFKGVLSDSDFIFIDYDATIPQKLNLQADYIIHGASNANPSVYAKEPVETLLAGIVGLQSILELARKNAGSRLLFISSSEVYGNRTDGSLQLYKESDYGYVDILNPRACYPNGKRAAETLCSCYMHEYGTDTVIVRPGHIYGPSISNTDSRASAAFTRDAAAGQNIVMKSAGTQLRSYCYTLDCASAILSVLICGNSGEAYNISNKNSIVSIKEMAEALAAAGDVQLTFENPTDAEIKSYNMMSNSALDSEKIESLGWKAAFSLESGAEKTICFYEPTV